MLDVGAGAGRVALRLAAAGHDVTALDRAVADGHDSGRPLYALPTYTALIELRELLADRGLAARWAD